MMSLADRFWAKVQKTEECWLWTASLSVRARGNSRGTFAVNRKTRLAHRVAWEMANGKPIPKGMMVCHHCDTPLCVRPDHLFLGTQKDNIRDMMAKGRRADNKPPRRTGEANPLAKLKNSDVLEIVNSVRRGDAKNAVARRYGIDPKVVRLIVGGLSWSEVTGIVPQSARDG